MKLRLTTQGRFALSEFSERVWEILVAGSWRVYGDLGGTNSLIIAEDPSGIHLGKDNRLFVANGQEICNIHEECELELRESIPGKGNRLLVFSIVMREAPSLEKAMNMAANPVKPPTIEKLDPEQQTFFEGVTPQRKPPLGRHPNQSVDIGD